MMSIILPPPHFHATYNGIETIFDINEGAFTKGMLHMRPKIYGVLPKEDYTVYVYFLTMEKLNFMT
ncbi:hypothetical protein JCM15765_23570 [Paradesulfitobacterium aromaticivorans]